jgi:hypothetical protein
MHDLETGGVLAARPGAGYQPVEEDSAECSARSVDALAVAFEAELAAWLTWVEAARDARTDEHAMRRLALVDGTGWLAIAMTVLAIPLLDARAAMLSFALLAGMLVLGCRATAPQSVSRDTTRASVIRYPASSSLGAADRARLVRIINLSRIAGSPRGAQLLLSELDEALDAEPLASWPPLRELRDVLRAGQSGMRHG